MGKFGLRVTFWMIHSFCTDKMSDILKATHVRNSKVVTRLKIIVIFSRMSFVIRKKLIHNLIGQTNLKITGKIFIL